MTSKQLEEKKALCRTARSACADANNIYMEAIRDYEHAVASENEKSELWPNDIGYVKAASIWNAAVDAAIDRVIAGGIHRWCKQSLDQFNRYRDKLKR